jgi:membrane-bound metal-dependent hydrolase YbcI (DUF457 family)
VPLPSRRRQHLASVPLLVGLVFGLDLLWAASGISTGSLAFGLVDEPAHLATCAIALLALSLLLDRPLPPAFVAAALLGSVAIDLDHLPGYLGWDGLIGAAPRPYSHSLVPILVLLGFGFLVPRRYRAPMLGLAFGISAHLLRDLATGPGVALGMPFSDAPVGVPYLAYALLLAALAAAAIVASVRGRRPRGSLPRHAGAAAALLVAVAVAASGPVEAAEAKPKQRRAAKSKVAMGIYLPEGEHNPAVIDSFAHAIGRQPAIVHVYQTWSEMPFDHAMLDSIWARGGMPLVSWEPWGEFEGQGVPLAEIAAGHWDAYIAESARQAAGWGGTFFVRFAHEMNGNWYPWGRDPVQYKAAWRRVVSIFRHEGATNVKWVWCPYVDFGKTPFKRYYPGDKWVDWAALDGFNWGEPFMSFRKIFDESYAKMVKLTSKPLMIPETGTIEGPPGAKATWIRRAYKRELPRYPHIRALVWFSDIHPRGMDWRVDTSASAFAALAGVMRKPQYSPPRGFLLSKPAWLKKKPQKQKKQRQKRKR